MGLLHYPLSLRSTHEGQVGVQITNVKLIIAELASKSGRDIRLQVADVSAPVHQMRRPNADLPLENSTA